MALVPYTFWRYVSSLHFKFQGLRKEVREISQIEVSLEEIFLFGDMRKLVVPKKSKCLKVATYVFIEIK